MLDKKVMDIEASEAYLDHQISGMRQQKKTHDWIYNELNFIVLIKNIFHKKRACTRATKVCDDRLCEKKFESWYFLRDI